MIHQVVDQNSIKIDVVESTIFFSEIVDILQPLVLSELFFQIHNEVYDSVY